MIGPPPETKDVRELKKWCDQLYQWLIFPDKFECNYIEVKEQSADITAPATNKAVIYAKDSGGGKTLVVVRFATGAVQTVATEP
jgi:hypothetical protein